ncbi:hypothetical protein Droror1_Dr00020413 [Drosera rotundifolia]
MTRSIKRSVRPLFGFVVRPPRTAPGLLQGHLLGWCPGCWRCEGAAHGQICDGRRWTEADGGGEGSFRGALARIGATTVGKVWWVRVSVERKGKIC